MAVTATMATRRAGVYLFIVIKQSAAMMAAPLPAPIPRKTSGGRGAVWSILRRRDTMGRTHASVPRDGVIIGCRTARASHEGGLWI